MNASNSFLLTGLLVLAVVGAAACERSIAGPEDGSVKVSLGVDSLGPSEPSSASAVLFYADGRLAGEKWIVDLTITGGVFEGDSVAIRRKTDRNGVVYVAVRSGAKASALIVTARAGGAVHADTALVKAASKP